MGRPHRWQHRHLVQQGPVMTAARMRRSLRRLRAFINVALNFERVPVRFTAIDAKASGVWQWSRNVGM